MKTKLTLTFLLLLALQSVRCVAQAPAWGVADTLEDYTIGPGISYTKINFPKKPLLMWIMAIDLTNPYNAIEQVQSNNKVPDVLRENVSSMSRRHTFPGHKVCAAFNHDFFSYDQGICIGLNISNGEVTQRAGDGRSTFAITKEKVASVFHPRFEGKVLMPGGESVQIDNYNWWAIDHYGDCVLFNRFNAIQLSDAGKYVRFKAKGEWLVNGTPIACEVLEVSDQPLQSSGDEYVLYARNSKANAFDNLKSGDEISISQKFVQGKFGVAPADIVTAFHGYPSIVNEGKFHDGEYNDFEGGREYEKSCRLMAGMSKDGKTVYLVATELSSKSTGIDCIELGNYMIAMGCWNVVNFDSGGSVAVVMDHTMQNEPGRGAIRPVADGVLFVSNAPEDTNIASYSFTKRVLNLPCTSLAPLSLIAHNSYQDVVEKEVGGFTFRCEPSEIGYVDEDAVFHASWKEGTGKIIAEKGGLRAEIPVSLLAIEDIKLSTGELLLDSSRPYPIRISGAVTGNTYSLDPGAFTWSVSDPGCCKVENGVLYGLENGSSSVTGVLGDYTLQFNVNVEIGKEVVTQESFADMSSFKVTASSLLANLSYSSQNLPEGWVEGVNVNFDQKAGRSPQLELVKQVRLYGLPDSLSIDMVLSHEMVSALYLSFSDRTGTEILRQKVAPTLGYNRIVIPFSDENGLFDTELFPISFDNMKFTLLGGARTGATLSLGALKAYYPKGSVSGIENSSVAVSPIRFWNDGRHMYVVVENGGGMTVELSLYHSNGMQFSRALQVCDDAGFVQGTFSLEELPKGVYIVSVRAGSEFKSFKLVR